MTFIPSPDQIRIFDFIRDDERSATIEAVAGSGKTTTIVEATKLVPNYKLTLFLAFNKNIATELQQRVPGHIQAKTFHSHCFGALQRNMPRRPIVDADKVWKILREDLNEKDVKLYGKFVNRLVSYAKNAGLGTDLMDDNSPKWWFHLIDYFNLMLDDDRATEENAVEIAQATLKRSNEQDYVVDFDDMLYLALLRRVTFDKCGYIFLDEAQDTNGVQRALLHMMRAPQGRLIAIGDPAQAIYGFRGADAEAMDRLAEDFSCVKLPLSVSYRCAQEVVKEAQKTVPVIQPHESALIGSVKAVEKYHFSEFSNEDAILCRVTVPLVALAFGFIRRGVGVRILGREIGQGLVNLVKRMNTEDLELFVEKLQQWRAREVAKAMRKGYEQAAANIEEKVDCLLIFVNALDEDNRTIDALIRRIETIFTDNNKGLLTLCSVHKAKGLEWNRVFILDRSKYMPSKFANQDWQRKQEQNLIYVAVTRAKEHLCYIESDKWTNTKDGQTKSEPSTQTPKVSEQDENKNAL